MPAIALIAVSLAAAEPPRAPRPFVMLQTSWSLTASPQALAAAEQERPIVGPGEVGKPILPAPATEEKKRQVTVLPAPDKPAEDLKDLDDLKAPAAEAVPAGPPAAGAATADMPADSAAAQAAAPDPLEGELAAQIKPTNDPLEGFNRISFAFSQVLDKILIRPLAITYVKVMPKPARDGMRNVLAHWGAPIIMANDLLQLKPKRAVRTLGRFLINTLLGLGGLFDVAREKKFNLPHHGNRFSNTLAFWGVKPGPYIYLPVLGPTTLRDEADRLQSFIPGFNNPAFRNNRGTVFQYMLGLEDRASNDQELKSLLEDSVDPYATFRETWLQDRQGEVDRLKAPDGKNPGDFSTAKPAAPATLDDPLIDPAAPAAAPEPAAPETATPPPEAGAKPAP